MMGMDPSGGDPRVVGPCHGTGLGWDIGMSVRRATKTEGTIGP